MFALKTFLILPALLLLSACSTPTIKSEAHSLSPLPAWKSTHSLDHPLVAKLYDAKHKRWLSTDEAFEQLTRASFIILGEKHDNPDHHQLQQWLISNLHQHKPLAGLGFEMMNTAQQAALDQLTPNEAADADKLAKKIQWQNGWGWDFYGPMVTFATQESIPMLATNITFENMRKIYRQSKADAIETPQALQKAIYDEIEASHCGALPKSQFGPMAQVQINRDLHMAQTLFNGWQQATQTGQKTIIHLAGNYHALPQVGIPYHLQQLAPEQGIVSVHFREAIGGELNPEDYFQLDENEPGIQDLYPEHSQQLYWFTPSIGEKDYCAKFKKPAHKK